MSDPRDSQRGSGDPSDPSSAADHDTDHLQERDPSPPSPRSIPIPIAAEEAPLERITIDLHVVVIDPTVTQSTLSDLHPPLCHYFLHADLASSGRLSRLSKTGRRLLRSRDIVGSSPSVSVYHSSSAEEDPDTNTLEVPSSICDNIRCTVVYDRVPSLKIDLRLRKVKRIDGSTVGVGCGFILPRVEDVPALSRLLKRRPFSRGVLQRFGDLLGVSSVEKRNAEILTRVFPESLRVGFHQAYETLLIHFVTMCRQSGRRGRGGAESRYVAYGNFSYRFEALRVGYCQMLPFTLSESRFFKLPFADSPLSRALFVALLGRSYNPQTPGERESFRILSRTLVDRIGMINLASRHIDLFDLMDACSNAFPTEPYSVFFRDGLVQVVRILSSSDSPSRSLGRAVMISLVCQQHFELAIPVQIHQGEVSGLLDELGIIFRKTKRRSQRKMTGINVERLLDVVIGALMEGYDVMGLAALFKFVRSDEVWFEEARKTERVEMVLVRILPHFDQWMSNPRFVTGCLGDDDLFGDDRIPVLVMRFGGYPQWKGNPKHVLQYLYRWLKKCEAKSRRVSDPTFELLINFLSSYLQNVDPSVSAKFMKNAKKVLKHSRSRWKSLKGLYQQVLSSVNIASFCRKWRGSDAKLRVRLRHFELHYDVCISRLIVARDVNSQSELRSILKTLHDGIDSLARVDGCGIVLGRMIERFGGSDFRTVLLSNDSAAFWCSLFQVAGRSNFYPVRNFVGVVREEIRRVQDEALTGGFFAFLSDASEAIRNFAALAKSLGESRDIQQQLEAMLDAYVKFVTIYQDYSTVLKVYCLDGIESDEWIDRLARELQIRMIRDIRRATSRIEKNPIRDAFPKLLELKKSDIFLGIWEESRVQAIQQRGRPLGMEDVRAFVWTTAEQKWLAAIARIRSLEIPVLELQALFRGTRERMSLLRVEEELSLMNLESRRISSYFRHLASADDAKALEEFLSVWGDRILSENAGESLQALRRASQTNWNEGTLHNFVDLIRGEVLEFEIDPQILKDLAMPELLAFCEMDDGTQRTYHDAILTEATGTLPDCSRRMTRLLRNIVRIFTPRSKFSSVSELCNQLKRISKPDADTIHQDACMIRPNIADFMTFVDRRMENPVVLNIATVRRLSTSARYFVRFERQREMGRRADQGEILEDPGDYFAIPMVFCTGPEREKYDLSKLREFKLSFKSLLEPHPLEEDESDRPEQYETNRILVRRFVELEETLRRFQTLLQQTHETFGLKLLEIRVEHVFDNDLFNLLDRGEQNVVFPEIEIMNQLMNEYQSTYDLHLGIVVQHRELNPALDYLTTRQIASALLAMKLMNDGRRGAGDDMTPGLILLQTLQLVNPTIHRLPRQSVTLGRKLSFDQRLRIFSELVTLVLSQMNPSHAQVKPGTVSVLIAEPGITQLEVVLKSFARAQERPCPSNLLFCTETTAEEQLRLFVSRFRQVDASSSPSKFFLIANLENLPFSVVFNFGRLLRQDVRPSDGELCVVSARRYGLLSQFETAVGDLDDVTPIVPRLEVVFSELAGSGKTTYVHRECHGTACRICLRDSVDFDDVMKRLLLKRPPRVFHFDLGSHVDPRVNNFLLTLMFGGFIFDVSRSQKVFACRPDDRFFVEIPTCRRFDRRLPCLSLVPHANLHQCVVDREHFCVLPFTDDPEEHQNESATQLVCKYLKFIDECLAADDWSVFSNKSDVEWAQELEGGECFDLISAHLRSPRPSFRLMNLLVKGLFNLFKHEGYLLGVPGILRWNSNTFDGEPQMPHHFRKFLLSLIVESIQYFVDRHVRVNTEAENPLLQFEWVKEWGNHDNFAVPIMVRTAEGSLAGFKFASLSSDWIRTRIRDACPEPAQLDDQMRRKCDHPQVRMPPFYRQLKFGFWMWLQFKDASPEFNFEDAVNASPEEAKTICEVMLKSVETERVLPPKQLRFTFTQNNFVKMIIIVQRLDARIPVVISGETGVGKTFMVNYIKELLDYGFEEKTIHVGVTDEEIRQMVLEAEQKLEHEMPPHSKFLIFFDEFNTRPSMKIFEELMIDRIIDGRKLHPGFRFVAAMNPYRRRDSRFIGLKLPEVAEERMRLVYSVYPLPQSFADCLFDFGALERDDEHQYSRSMTLTDAHPHLRPHVDLVVRVIQICHEFLRSPRDEDGIGGGFEDNSVVSLRDIQRLLKSFNFLHIDCGVGLGRSFLLAIAFSYYTRLRRRQRIQLSGLLQNPNGDGTENLIENIRVQMGIVDVRGIVDELEQEEEGEMQMPFRAYRRHDEQADEEEDTSLLAVALRRESRSFTNLLQLEDDIALNESLTENTFMQFIGLRCNIPVLIIGLPGTSKSLSIEILSKGFDDAYGRGRMLFPGRFGSPDPRGRHYEELLGRFQMFPLQCSKTTKAIGILKIRDRALEHVRAEVRSEDDDRQLVVCLLEEIGLCLLSADNPMKVMHSLIDARNDLRLLAISNYELDEATSNRFKTIVRDEPTVLDLIKTAEGIVSTRQASFLLSSLSHAFVEVRSLMKEKNWFGLRSFYSLVKAVSRHQEDMRALSDKTFLKLILRNFGGRDQAMTQEIVRIFAQKTNRPQLNTIPRLTPLELVMANVQDQNARHLMLITKNNAALGMLLESQLRTQYRLEVQFGSDFAADQHEDLLSIYLNRIKLAMGIGQKLVLVGCQEIFENLYELLNQHYTHNIGKGKMTNIALGNGDQAQLFLVDNNFRLIVIVEEFHAYHTLPAPFLNRFEKQVFRPGLVAPRNPNFAEALSVFVDRVGLNNFVGCHTETVNTISDIAFPHDVHLAGEVYRNADEETLEVLVRRDKLLSVCTIDGLVRVREEIPELVDCYFRAHPHILESGRQSDVNPLERFIKKRVDDGIVKPALVMTFSPMIARFSREFRGDSVVFSLHEVGSYQLVLEIVKNFFSAENDKFVLLCYVDLNGCTQHQVQFLLHLFDTELERRYMTQEDPENRHSVIVVKLPLNRPTGLFHFDFSSRWDVSLIDNVNGFHEHALPLQLQTDEPPLKVFLQEPLSEIFGYLRVGKGKLGELIAHSMRYINYHSRTGQVNLDVPQKIREITQFLVERFENFVWPLMKKTVKLLEQTSTIPWLQQVPRRTGSFGFDAFSYLVDLFARLLAVFLAQVDHFHNLATSSGWGAHLFNLVLLLNVDENDMKNRLDYLGMSATGVLDVDLSFRSQFPFSGKFVAAAKKFFDESESRPRTAVQLFSDHVETFQRMVMASVEHSLPAYAYDYWMMSSPPSIHEGVPPAVGCRFLQAFLHQLVVGENKRDFDWVGIQIGLWTQNKILPALWRLLGMLNRHGAATGVLDRLLESDRFGPDFVSCVLRWLRDHVSARGAGGLVESVRTVNQARSSLLRLVAGPQTTALSRLSFFGKIVGTLGRLVQGRDLMMIWRTIDQNPLDMAPAAYATSILRGLDELYRRLPHHDDPSTLCAYSSVVEGFLLEIISGDADPEVDACSAESALNRNLPDLEADLPPSGDLVESLCDIFQKQVVGVNLRRQHAGMGNLRAVAQAKRFIEGCQRADELQNALLNPGGPLSRPLRDLPREWRSWVFYYCAKHFLRMTDLGQLRTFLARREISHGGPFSDSIAQDQILQNSIRLFVSTQEGSPFAYLFRDRFVDYWEARTPLRPDDGIVAAVLYDQVRDFGVQHLQELHGAQGRDRIIQALIEKRFPRIDGNNHLRRVMVHILSVGWAGNSFWRTLLDQPNSLAGAYLPTMPADNRAMLARVVGNGRGQFYQCPCGQYEYFVGECGQPMQLGQCPRCHRNIGGQGHNPAAGNRGIGRNFASRTGYFASIAFLNKFNHTENFTPRSFRILRFMMNCLLWFSTIQDPNRVRQLVDANVLGNADPIHFFGQHLVRDWGFLKELMGRNDEGVASACHYVLQRMSRAQIPVVAFRSVEERGNWEQSFVTYCRQHCAGFESPRIDELADQFLADVNAHADGADALTKVLLEQPDAERATPSIFMIRMSPSYDDFLARLAALTEEDQEDSPLLAEFVKHQQVLENLHNGIFVCLQVLRFVYEKTSNRIRPDDARGISIQEFMLDRLERDERQQWRRLFDTFCQTFAELWSDLRRLNCQLLHENFRFRTDTLLSQFLPDEGGESVILVFLQNLCAMNNRLHAAATNAGFLEAFHVSTASLQPGQCLEYDPEDIRSFVLAHCTPHRNTVVYDFDAVQRHVYETLLQDKAVIDFVPPPFRYLGEKQFAALEVLKRTLCKIPETEKEDIRRLLTSSLTKASEATHLHRTRLRDFVTMCVPLLSAVSSHLAARKFEERTFAEYVETVVGLVDRIPDQVLPSRLRERIKIRHLLVLHQFLADLLEENPFAGLSPRYQVKCDFLSEIGTKVKPLIKRFVLQQFLKDIEVCRLFVNSLRALILRQYVGQDMSSEASLLDVVINLAYGVEVSDQEGDALERLGLELGEIFGGRLSDLGKHLKTKNIHHFWHLCDRVFRKAELLGVVEVSRKIESLVQGRSHRGRRLREEEEEEEGEVREVRPRNLVFGGGGDFDQFLSSPGPGRDDDSEDDDPDFQEEDVGRPSLLPRPPPDPDPVPEINMKMGEVQAYIVDQFHREIDIDTLHRLMRRYGNVDAVKVICRAYFSLGEMAMSRSFEDIERAFAQYDGNLERMMNSFFS